MPIVSSIPGGEKNPLKTMSLNASSADVLTGKTFVGANKTQETGTIPVHSPAATQALGFSGTQSYSKGYYDKDFSVTAPANPLNSMNLNASSAQVLSGYSFVGANKTQETGTMPVYSPAAAALLDTDIWYTYAQGYYDKDFSVYAPSSGAVGAAATITSLPSFNSTLSFTIDRAQMPTAITLYGNYGTYSNSTSTVASMTTLNNTVSIIHYLQYGYTYWTVLNGSTMSLSNDLLTINLGNLNLISPYYFIPGITYTLYPIY